MAALLVAPLGPALAVPSAGGGCDVRAQQRFSSLVRFHFCGFDSPVRGNFENEVDNLAPQVLPTSPRAFEYGERITM